VHPDDLAAWIAEAGAEGADDALVAATVVAWEALLP
jgi:hypothetical protein